MSAFLEEDIRRCKDFFLPVLKEQRASLAVASLEPHPVNVGCTPVLLKTHMDQFSKMTMRAKIVNHFKWDRFLRLGVTVK